MGNLTTPKVTGPVPNYPPLPYTNEHQRTSTLEKSIGASDFTNPPHPSRSWAYTSAIKHITPTTHDNRLIEAAIFVHARAVHISFLIYRMELKLIIGVTMKNSLPSESSENTVLGEIQYGESNGGNRFSIGRSMTKLCIKINQNCGATRARKLLSTNAELNEMDPKL